MTLLKAIWAALGGLKGALIVLAVLLLTHSVAFSAGYLKGAHAVELKEARKALEAANAELAKERLARQDAETARDALLAVLKEQKQNVESVLLRMPTLVQADPTHSCDISAEAVEADRQLWTLNR